MTIKEFVELTNNIERYYEKELTEFNRQVWYSQLKHLSADNYKRVIVEVFKNCKKMPTLADIQEIMKSTFTQTRDTEKDKIYVPCKKCGGSGLIRYFRKYGNYKYEFVARCSCENSKNYEWKDKNGNFLIPEVKGMNLGV